MSHGHLFEPESLGCRGGDGFAAGSGGRGGGVIRLTVHTDLKVDGEISCNGDSGHSSGGGGSGGTIHVVTHNMQACILQSLILRVIYSLIRCMSYSHS